MLLLLTSSTVDECDAPSDVTSDYVIGDHVIYEDEFIHYAATEDEVDAPVSSIDDDGDYEELVSSPVRFSTVFSLLNLTRNLNIHLHLSTSIKITGTTTKRNSVC